MKIYFAGSIRGGRQDVDLYQQIIVYLRNYGEVLTEHLGHKKFSSYEENLTDQEVHDRDVEWLLASDVVIAEVSTNSLGVGYEIGRAVANKKRILCLFRKQRDKKLSAMIAGSPQLTVKEYNDLEEIKKIIDEFLKK